MPVAARPFPFWVPLLRWISPGHQSGDDGRQWDDLQQGIAEEGHEHTEKPQDHRGDGERVDGDVIAAADAGRGGHLGKPGKRVVLFGWKGARRGLRS